MSPSTLPKLNLIVAVTPSLGIGRGGTLPWPRIKTEMAYFSRITKRVPSPNQKNAVVMGRKTWESIPDKFRPLPGRINVVVSRQPGSLKLETKGGAVDETYAAASLQEGLNVLREKHGDNLGRVWVIGGAEVYAEALKRPEADKVLLTRIKQDYKCDTFFPVDFMSDGKDNASDWVREDQQSRDKWLMEEGTGDEEWDVEFWSRKRNPS